ncbi:MAG: hypothetical protein LBB17_00310 [Puniceicoccales bacterium]|jgi:hypothetical protein|nr:hypothetical protein [Puniceicoccales bacterium]
MINISYGKPKLVCNPTSVLAKKAKESFLKRVQILQLREYDDAVEFLSQVA